MRTRTHKQIATKHRINWFCVHCARAQRDDKGGMKADKAAGYVCVSKEVVVLVKQVSKHKKGKRSNISFVPHQVKHFQSHFPWIRKECAIPGLISNIDSVQTRSIHTSSFFLPHFQWNDCASKFQWLSIHHWIEMKDADAAMQSAQFLRRRRKQKTRQIIE